MRQFKSVECKHEQLKAMFFKMPIADRADSSVTGGESILPLASSSSSSDSPISFSRTRESLCRRG